VLWDGKWGLCSACNSSSPPLLFAHSFPLLQSVSSPWAAVLRDKAAPTWVPQELQFLQGISTFSGMGSSTGRSCGCLLQQGVLSMGLREISPLASGAPLPPPPSMMLLFTLLFLALVSLLTPLYSQTFLTFLKRAFPRGPSFLVRASAVPCGGSVGLLELAVTSWHWPCPQQGSPSLPSPLQPPARKHCHLHPVQGP